MIKGKTSSGFSYELDKDALNDMELIDALAIIDEDPAGASMVVKKVLGDEQRGKLYEHLRDDKGRVPADKVMQELEEIFNNSGDAVKNS